MSRAGAALLAAGLLAALALAPCGLQRLWVMLDRPGTALPPAPVAVAQEPGPRVYLPLGLRAAAPEPPGPAATAPPRPSATAVATATVIATATAAATAAATTAATTAPPVPPDFAPFGLAEVAPERRLEGSGVTVDSLAFWEAPAAEDTLLLATAKGNGRVEVWGWPFEGPERAALQDPHFTGSSVNGIAVDAVLGRAYVSVARPSSSIVAFALPGLEPLGALVSGSIDLRSEPNLALLTLSDGSRRLYASADDHVYALDPADGSVLGSFATTHAIENLVADDLAQALYLPDETRRGGVFAYRPDGQPFERGGATRFGGDGTFEADAEGIAIYACRAEDGQDDGRGLIIVADQKSDATDFEVFDRRSWTHLGRLQVTGVRLTDGVAASSRPLPDQPAGLFAAVDNDAAVVLVGWERIARATGLHCAGPPGGTATPLPTTALLPNP